MIGRLAILLLKGYKLTVSPYMPSACRYFPTCSEYAQEAIAKHGALKGVGMAAKRLGRCHPASAGGYDPVPEQDAGHK